MDNNLRREIIIDAYQNPHNRGLVDDSSYLTNKQASESCIDNLDFMMKIEDNIVKDISYIGLGCAISQASTAMLVELIQGKSVSESKEIIDIFFKMIKDTAITEEEKDRLNDASILEFTKDMPARIKCSTLSWHSTKVVLDKYN